MKRGQDGIQQQFLVTLAGVRGHLHNVTEGIGDPTKLPEKLARHIDELESLARLLPKDWMGLPEEAKTSVYPEWKRSEPPPPCKGCDGSGWQVSGPNEGWLCDFCDRACVCKGGVKNNKCPIHRYDSE